MSENQTENKPAETTAATPEAPATEAPAKKAAAKAETTAVADTPAEKAAPAEAPKKEEPPFSTDQLKNCTSRFTRKAWDIFLDYDKDMELIRNKPLRASLTTRTAGGAEELQKQLSEAGVREISRADRKLSFTATFEQVQTVIKDPETEGFDAVRV